MRSFVAYTRGKCSLYREEINYRIYMSDCAKASAESAGAEVKSRYFDIIRIHKTDRRSGAEIANDVLQRAGIKVTE